MNQLYGMCGMNYSNTEENVEEVLENNIKQEEIDQFIRNLGKNEVNYNSNETVIIN